MSAVVPARLDKKIVKELDDLVARGFYLSRSDAVRDAVRRLIMQVKGGKINYSRIHRLVADVAAYLIVANMKEVTDVILYGSVARGESNEESDIDLLVLISDGEEWKVESRLYDLLYPVMLSSNQALTIHVFTRKKFEKLISEKSLFALDVANEGVQLCGGILNELRGQCLY